MIFPSVFGCHGYLLFPKKILAPSRGETASAAAFSASMVFLLGDGFLDGFMSSNHLSAHLKNHLLGGLAWLGHWFDDLMSFNCNELGSSQKTSKHHAVYPSRNHCLPFSTSNTTPFSTSTCNGPRALPAIIVTVSPLHDPNPSTPKLAQEAQKKKRLWANCFQNYLKSKPRTAKATPKNPKRL